MSTRAQTFELLTPCFCAGISKLRPELRIPSIRGQLRWWARVLYGKGSPEYAFFGGIHGKRHVRPGSKDRFDEEGVASSFKFGLITTAGNAKHAEACLVPHKCQQNGFWAMALPIGNSYTLEWTPQPHPEFRDQATHLIDGQTRQHRLDQIVRAWLLLGGLGRRITRAAGSVWPLGYAPTTDEFQAAVTALALDSHVKVAVLKDTRTDAEALRAIADKTIHRPFIDGRPGTTRGMITGDPLGYVDRGDRKASPLRLKVGRFADGFRLIAIWDHRDRRGGSMTECIAALRADLGRELGDLLHAVGF